MSHLPPLRPAVFLDRDGTINEEVSYLHRVQDFRFIPGAEGAVARLKRAGFAVVVVSNQSGIARGYFDEQAVHTLHAHMDGLLREAGTRIDAYYFCPHHEKDGTVSCECRKPLPGMVTRAAAELGLALERSFMVGDKECDVQAALAAGCRPVLVRTGYGAAEAAKIPAGVPVVDSLVQAADLIIRHAEAGCIENAVEGG
ncbi:MAG TPA: D-glycero-beta-D-manno-heptose 1,7-bisphosphate 7-phosphatase [Verrucomicrobiae bacterium]|nr:D-glycero-beta-D-manno-heptose 1,7-bisphosphate 7-phosphatase [Verrucomicrobiae bacterium]